MKGKHACVLCNTNILTTFGINCENKLKINVKKYVKL